MSDRDRDHWPTYSCQAPPGDCPDGDVQASVTDEQIQALRDEAREAGDTAQVAQCDRALAGESAARWAVQGVIEDAQWDG